MSDLNYFLEYLQTNPADSFKEWMQEKKYQGRETGGKYPEFEKTSSKVVKYGASLLVGPVGPILVALYRTMTDSCVKTCGTNNQVCYNKCYYNASAKIVRKIESELSKAKSIPDEKKRAKAIKKLSRELQHWKKREKLYADRVKAAK